MRSGDAGAAGRRSSSTTGSICCRSPALTARLLELARRGPDAAGDAREALALGHVYARGALEERRARRFRRALERCRSPRGAYDPIRIEALRALALAAAARGGYDEAARCWRELLEMRGCPRPIVREATEALAIHHEHRVRDLDGRRKRSRCGIWRPGGEPGWSDAAHHRLARIEQEASEARSLKFEGEV